MNHVARIKRAQRARWKRRWRQVVLPTILCFDECAPISPAAWEQIIRRTAHVRQLMTFGLEP